MNGQHDQSLVPVFITQLHQVGLVSMADGAVIAEEVQHDDLAFEVLEREGRRVVCRIEFAISSRIDLKTSR